MISFSFPFGLHKVEIIGMGYNESFDTRKSGIENEDYVSLYLHWAGSKRQTDREGS